MYHLIKAARRILSQKLGQRLDSSARRIGVFRTKASYEVAICRIERFRDWLLCCSSLHILPHDLSVHVPHIQCSLLRNQVRLL